MKQLKQSLNILKAMGDESRLIIIDSLRERGMYVEELAKRLNLADSTVSFHLKKLEAAGIVRSVKEQYYVVYHLNEDLLQLSLKDLSTLGNMNRAVQDDRMQEYREKVLRTFFRSGTLERLPSQYKKKIIILEEILGKFSTEIIYPEKEIDAVISEVYDDYCAIRRLFIDEKMMLRKDGNYRINPEYRPDFPVKNSKEKENRKKTGMDKSEIKREYKLTGAPMGVYKVINILTGKIFLGSAKNLNGMINRHKFELSTRIHTIKEMQDSWDKEKETALKFEIVDILKPKPLDEPGYNYTEDLEELEELWADKLLSEGINVIRLSATRIRKK
jgi:predicted DNA-binding transcriptional regulator